MSYPDPRYLGDGGETTAVLRPADTPPDLTGPDPGWAAHYLATGTTTGGDYGLYRWDMSASPSGPGPHFHRTMSEAFFVLAGNPQLYDGNGWHHAGPGDFLHVPPGGLHGFRNESGRPASLLILFTPGAPREAYFEGLNEFARSGRWPDQEELLAFFAEHDNHYV
jgi:mannose-6-phosphate isomerase-like protein (cupin superfamily)